ncbi:MAG: 16S rRNA (cytidine(1402)-2'-O)-methyltransferase [bacterium]
METGKIYIIGTPIGNLGDITLRALKVIDTLDILVCEDTRVTSGLINYYLEKGLLTHRPRYIACNDFNEARVSPNIVEMVKSGQVVGLVSDAGMPTISDPGFRVIKGCLDEKLRVVVVPGVSSVTTALTMSGLGGDHFLFLGFLPKKVGKRKQLLETMKIMMEQTESLKIVIFMSPHRISKELSEIKEALGEVTIVLLREMTKKFEEKVELSITELIKKYETTKARGEMVLVMQKVRES